MKTYVIAEIGINHNGSMDLCKQLINVAKHAGCDAVKFQKRYLEYAVPPNERDKLRDTPWGTMTYYEYKQRIEFGVKEYKEIDAYCKQKGIDWLVSVWDKQSVDFMEEHFPDQVMYKVPSALLTQQDLVSYTAVTRKHLILSTGMSTMDEIRATMNALRGLDNIVLMHCTSSYPAKLEELNLKMINTLQKEFPRVTIGYSGHEAEVTPTVLAVTLGAKVIERHITLDKSMWGTDQSASLDPKELKALVSGVRFAETCLGDGIKKVYDSELGVREKLRG